MTDLHAEHTQRSIEADHFVSVIEDEDVFYVLRALEKRFEMKISILDRNEIAELFAMHDHKLDDERWAVVTSTQEWDEWSADTWVAWRNTIGSELVEQVVDATRGSEFI